MANLSPMMKQYMDLKDAHKDCILLFRLGDFYEMFFEDAILVSNELDLTLTGRDCGLKEKAPMCGVPYHARDIYLNKLLEKGYKVAICEQTTLPKKGVKIVERDVVRIVTPGTVIEDSLLNEGTNNYIASLYKDEFGIGIAYCDISTGEFYISEIDEGDYLLTLFDELTRINPIEIITNREVFNYLSDKTNIMKSFNISFEDKIQSYYEESFAKAILKKHFNLDSAVIINDEQSKKSACAAGALINYFSETQKTDLLHINKILKYKLSSFMSIDNFTRKSLELTTTIRNNNKKGSLLWVIDKTITSMGSRKIKKFLEQPILNKSELYQRYDAVEAIKDDILSHHSLREYLKSVKDIERLTTKISYGSISPRECLLLKQSLEVIPDILIQLDKIDNDAINSIKKKIDKLEDVHQLLHEAISIDPPILMKDGGVIRDGYSSELDDINTISRDGKVLITNMEEAERQSTGIKNLKIKYNRVFGYFIEVTRSYTELVPYRYSRKQTLANAERYITDELKELEGNILGAQQNSLEIEARLFTEIKNALKEQIKRLQATADSIAVLDAYQSFATCAIENDYIKPELNNEGILEIRDSRHPVVENASTTSGFVPNNASLDIYDNRFIIITGPNMSGKSTYLRQIALITIMAHIGCFVPASYANISITDKVFSRVGASDDLFLGQSTFMVEMNEVAQILKNATKNSLIILDEIGRGTATFDGLSIAWSIVEYICDKSKIGAKTLFATHYHQLSELEGRVDGVKNYCVSVREYKDEIIFLRKIVRGGTDKSFGLHVAKLAGIPEEVLIRSNELLLKLETADINNIVSDANSIIPVKPMEVDDDEIIISDKLLDLIKEVKDMDLTITTPIDTFFLVKRLKEKL